MRCLFNFLPFCSPWEEREGGGGWLDLVYAAILKGGDSISKAKTIQLKGSQVFRKSSCS